MVSAWEKGKPIVPEKTYNMTRIAWIDVETTGLVDPSKGVRCGRDEAGNLLPGPYLIEAALVITDGDLRELASVSLRVDPGFARKELASVTNQVALEMHQRNGLWEESPGIEVALAEVEMSSLLEQYRDPACPYVWGGSSPGSLDRPLLAYCMPDFYKRISHRTLDVSCLKMAMNLWGGVPIPDTEPNHRALDDTRHAIEMAKSYMADLGCLKWVIHCLKERVPA